jgi:hypothetical protein
MRMLRRTGFAVTLVSGLALIGSAVQGFSGMDTRLELAASEPPARSVLVVDRDRTYDGCEDHPSDRSVARQHDLDREPAFRPRA